MNTIVDLMSEEGSRIPGPRAEGFRRMLRILGEERVPSPVYALRPEFYKHYREQDDEYRNLMDLKTDLLELFEKVRDDPTSNGVALRSSFENPNGKYTPFVQGPNRHLANSQEAYHKTAEVLRYAYRLEDSLGVPLNVSVLFHPFKESSERVGGTVITHKRGRFAAVTACYGLAERAHDSPVDSVTYLVRSEKWFKPEICPVNFQKLKRKIVLGKGLVNVKPRFQQRLPLAYEQVWCIAEDALRIARSYKSPVMMEFSGVKYTWPDTPFYIDCRKMHRGEWLASDLAFGDEKTFAPTIYYELMRGTSLYFDTKPLIKWAIKNPIDWWYQTLEERRFSNTIFSILKDREEPPTGEMSGRPIYMGEVFDEQPCIPVDLTDVNSGKKFEADTNYVTCPTELWLSMLHAKAFDKRRFS